MVKTTDNGDGTHSHEIEPSDIARLMMAPGPVSFPVLDKWPDDVVLRDIGEEADAQIEHLEAQIQMLAGVLMNEFGGPDRDESACEMAIRLIREQKSQR